MPDTTKQLRVDGRKANQTSFKKGHKGISWLGRKPTAEHIEKIKEAKARNPYRHNEERRKKISEAGKGERNPHWRGGITPENKARFNDINWRKRAQEARLRDNFTCQNCGDKPAISVHHIVPWRVSKDDSLKNLITLCKSCHLKIEKKIQTWKR